MSSIPRPTIRPDMRKTVYIVPSLITITNIYAGFYSVVEALKGYKYLGMERVDLATHHFNIAAMCIGWSVLCDFLDGRIARMMNATSDFGVELDSLADVLSFGIAPAVLAYTWGFGGALPGFEKIAWGVSFMYLICGALRLARFNVMAHKPAPVVVEPSGKPAKKYFVGLPIPAAAGLIAAIAHFAPIPIPKKLTDTTIFGQHVMIDGQTYAMMLLALVITLALLMVSTIKFQSFKGAGPHNRINRFQMLLLIAMVMWLIYNYSEWTLLVMATAYAAQGPFGKFLGLFQRQSNTISPEAIAD
ncbi:MAG: CDP-diacylglycerol--serine O-phosphatidyltransferase [Blastocatellia bacterium]|nr:CDP-diacylglycerol--serine O-phosphatidyltransferase [Blastocatellia bacterium]